MAPRASAAPPVPRASTSTASRDVYFRRNLQQKNQQRAEVFGIHLVVLPSSRLGQGALVGGDYVDMVEAVQRHCDALPGTEAADDALSARSLGRRSSRKRAVRADGNLWRSGRMRLCARSSGVGRSTCRAVSWSLV
jgi:hypothetical protein